MVAKPVSGLVACSGNASIAESTFRDNATYRVRGNISIHSDLINKFFLIIMAPKFNWSEHVKHVVTKVSKGISIINKAKKYMKS